MNEVRRLRRKLLLGVAGAVVAGAALSLVGAPPAEVPEYRLKAELLERFTRFVDWPAEPAPTLRPGGPGDGAAANGPFQICVLGPNPFGDSLEEVLKEHQIKGRPGKVRLLDRAEDSAGCHVLFVARGHSGRVEKTLLVVAGRPVLTVSDTEGFAERGVMVNLYSEGANVRFEINEAMVRRSGLVVSSRLLKLARIVGGEGDGR